MNTPGRLRRLLHPRLLVIVPATALAAAVGLTAGGLLTIPGFAHADSTRHCATPTGSS